MKKYILVILLVFLSGLLSSGRAVQAQTVQAQTVQAAAVPPALKLSISSASDLSGVAGDYVAVRGSIANTGSKPLSDITTYLSLVNNDTKLPVDLEDWSAEKGLFVGTIAAGKTFPLNWKIHFVTAGNYSLSVVAVVAGDNRPQISQLTYFKVSPKHNLNPGQVLPVALGTPLLLLFIMLMLNYYRLKADQEV